MSSINFIKGTINVSLNAYSLPKEANSVLVNVDTDIEYVVDIPDEAKSKYTYVAYGVLYNLTAAKAGACPPDWHLPGDAECIQLINYLAENGVNYDGSIGGGVSKIAKSLATEYGWEPYNMSGVVGNTDFPEYRNKSGFSALPGASMNSNGSFSYLGFSGSWWSVRKSNESFANYYRLSNSNNSLLSGIGYSELGYSIRCVRDYYKK